MRHGLVEALEALRKQVRLAGWVIRLSCKQCQMKCGVYENYTAQMLMPVLALPERRVRLPARRSAELVRHP